MSGTSQGDGVYVPHPANTELHVGSTPWSHGRQLPPGCHVMCQP